MVLLQSSVSESLSDRVTRSCRSSVLKFRFNARQQQGSLRRQMSQLSRRSRQQAQPPTSHQVRLSVRLIAARDEASPPEMAALACRRGGPAVLRIKSS